MRIRSQSGQALVEWAFMLPLFLLVILGFIIFARWFLIQEELIMATREGAMLYSTGRIPAAQVRWHMQDALRRSYPSLEVEDNDIYVGRSQDPLAKLFQLDQVEISYPRDRYLGEFFKRDFYVQCVIKHAPEYGHPGLESYGPPVSW